MATFEELNWSDLDTWAIFAGRGVVAVEAAAQDEAAAWLQRHSYEVLHLTFGSGISCVVAQLGSTLDWVSQFGYDLKPESRNLDALRDGFEFIVPNEGGLVLNLQAFERAWQEDQRWCIGFLAIISEFSLRQLGAGRRFFAVVEVASKSSALVGSEFQVLSIGYPFQLGHGAA